MKILVISDTHGKISNLERLLERIRPIDLLLHLGDIENDKEQVKQLAGCRVEAVSGNNDWLGRDPRELILELGRHRILMTHGHRFSVYYGTEQLKEHARENKADVVIYGHTHIPEMDLSGDIWVMNPGSISYPRGGSRYSYIVMDLDSKGELHPTLFSL